VISASKARGIHHLQEYTEIREEYYATLIDKKWKSITEASFGFREVVMGR